MAPTVRVQIDAVEPIGGLVVSASGVPLTGLTNIKLRVRRTSDDLALDWADQSFKAPAGATTLLLALSEVDATYQPGLYQLDTAPHTGGFHLDEIVNKTAGDCYQFEIVQDGAPQTAGNVPQLGEIRETGWGDWSVTEQTQIRGALGIVGAQATPAGGGELQDLQAAVDALNDVSSAEVQAAAAAALVAAGYTSARAAMIELSKKMLINRLELADGTTGNWVLYDDDDNSVLLTFDVTDKNDAVIVQPSRAPSRRSRGT